MEGRAAVNPHAASRANEQLCTKLSFQRPHRTRQGRLNYVEPARGAGGMFGLCKYDIMLKLAELNDGAIVPIY